MTNILVPGQLYDMDVYVNTMPSRSFFSNSDKLKGPTQKTSKPVWSGKDLIYSVEMSPLASLNYTLPTAMVKSVLTQNKTIYMHMQVHFRTQADDPSTKDERFL